MAYNKEYRDKYYYENHDKVLEYARGLRAKLKEENPVHHKAMYMASGLQWGKGATDRMEGLLVEALGNPCKYCGQDLTIRTASLDHKKPYTKKTGTYTKEEKKFLNSLDNVHIVCFKCNRMKGNFTHEEYSKLLDIMNEYPELGVKLFQRLARATLVWGRGGK